MCWRLCGRLMSLVVLVITGYGVCCQLECFSQDKILSQKLLCQKACKLIKPIESFFDVKSDTVGVIKVVSDSDYFLKVKAPTWSNAFFVNGVIFLPVSSVKSKTFERALKHELTHLVIYKNFGPRIPEWLEEGLALYLEGEPNDILKNFFNDWRLSKNRLSLFQITRGISSLPKKDAVQAYAVSYYAVKLMLDQGRKTDILRALQEGLLPSQTTEQIERALLKF
ncbi:MAG: peptidase MA family metallohydrolase [Deltaproteobacteria bacterium]|nr:peptidase MA family metallohydrolase [Deltaproteobacteria bacterium]